MGRELRELEREENLIKKDLKRRAEKCSYSGKNDPSLKALAKQLVQVRKQKDKLVTTKSHIGMVGMQTKSMASQMAFTSIFSKVTASMKVANTMMGNPQDTQKMMNGFTMENERMSMKQELMDDAINDAFDNDEIEDEANEITSQVLAELGVELDSKFVGLDAPSGTRGSSRVGNYSSNRHSSMVY